MSHEQAILCPDCGGVIGSQPGEGQYACKCFQDDFSAVTRAKDASDTDRLSSSEVGISHSESSDADPAAPNGTTIGQELQKFCVLCGMNVTHKPRTKDSRGYVCYACAKEEQRRERGDSIVCDGCSRRMRPQAIESYEGKKLCPTCFKEAINQRRGKFDTVSSRHHTEAERNRVKGMLIILGIILFLIVLHQLGLLGEWT